MIGKRLWCLVVLTKMVKKRKQMNQKDKKVTSTTFFLIFPSLVLAGIAIANSAIGYGLIALGLWLYQAAVIQKYVTSQIED